MDDRIAGTMYVFGIVFFIAAIVAAIAAYLASIGGEKEAADLAKKLFNNCVFFALLLLAFTWLIS